MLQRESVTHVAVTTVRDNLGNETTTEAAPVTRQASVAIGDTREQVDRLSPELVADYTLYFWAPNLPNVGASDWFTVRGDRCEVISGPNGRWGSMGEVVAVQRTGQRP